MVLPRATWALARGAATRGAPRMASHAWRAGGIDTWAEEGKNCHFWEEERRHHHHYYHHHLPLPATNHHHLSCRVPVTRAGVGTFRQHLRAAWRYNFARARVTDDGIASPGNVRPQADVGIDPTLLGGARAVACCVVFEANLAILVTLCAQHFACRLTRAREQRQSCMYIIWCICFSVIEHRVPLLTCLISSSCIRVVK